MKITKRILSLVMVVVTLVSFMGIAAEAASVSLKELNLGYMVPIDAKGTKTIETVKLYGDYDYINFYINSRKTNSYFAYEIYSDKSNTKLVEGDIVACDATGTYTFTPKIKLKGKYESKTYYMITYAAKVYSDGSISIDKNSTREFKVVVKRTASFGDKVVMLKEAKNTTKGVNVSWSKLSGASKYYIYRRSIKGTKWTKVGATGSSKTSFTDTSAKNKGKYVYTVKGISKSGKASRYLYFGLTIIFAKAPTMKSIAVTYDNAIEIKWNSTSSKAKYTIMRKAGGGSWKTIKTNYSGTSYKDTSVKSGTKYTYSVKAVIRTDYGDAISSYYSNSDKVVTYLRMPTLKEAVAVENGVKVKWASVDGAKGYTVYRKPLGTSNSWKKLKTVDSDITSYIDTTASTTNGAYLYTVCTEGKNNRGSYNSQGIEYLVLDKPVISVERVSDSNSVKIIWKHDPLVSKYRVYRREKNGEWEYVGSEFAYYNNDYDNLNKAGVFEYRVKALRDEGAGKTYSDYSKAVSYKHAPYVYFSQIVHTDSIEIRLHDDYGYDKYNVYRKVSKNEDDKYVLVGSTTDDYFIDDSLKKDVAYTYQVRGVLDGVEQKKYTKSYTCGINTSAKAVKKPTVKVIDGELDSYGYYESYGYDFKKGCWMPMPVSGTRDSYKSYLNKKTGKYRFAFCYKNDKGLRTPIESCIVDFEWFDKTIDYTAELKKEGIVVTFDSLGDNVRYYEIGVRYIESKRVYEDGSDSYRVVLDSYPQSDTVVIETMVVTKNGDETHTKDKVKLY